jgi:hypothetical protein
MHFNEISDDGKDIKHTQEMHKSLKCRTQMDSHPSQRKAENLGMKSWSLVLMLLGGRKKSHHFINVFYRKIFTATQYTAWK